MFIFYENWRSQQDLDEHLEQPYLKEFVEKAEDLSKNGVDITLLRMVSVPNAGTAGR